MKKTIDFLSKPVNNAPLVVFRFLFGLVMFLGVIRFWAKGWIDTLYVQPDYFFPYYGFEWVGYPGDTGIYLLFIMVGLSALMVALGLFYRVAIIIFFLSFTWIELIDKSLYLNHYYFVSLMAGLLIFLPAAARFSLDSKFGMTKVSNQCAVWMVFAPKLLIGSLYFFAGFAKLNHDWLLEALPLKLWLPANSHLPFIGDLLTWEITAYLFSWIGMIFDLTVFFFLLVHRTRPYAYFFVLVFHLSTAMLFQIGIFPYIMPIVTLIFFSSKVHEWIINKAGWFGKIKMVIPEYNYRLSSIGIVALLSTTLFIIFFPMRYLLYPGNMYWHEQGFRFGWRVMLMEKAGYATFYVEDLLADKTYEVLPSEYLTPNQEKQMATQPDMIIQFAKYIESEFTQDSNNDSIRVTCECYATLNGGPMSFLIDPSTDLTKLDDTWSNKEWVLPYEK